MNKYLIRSLQNFKLKKIKNLFLIQNFKYDNKKKNPLMKEPKICSKMTRASDNEEHNTILQYANL